MVERHPRAITVKYRGRQNLVRLWAYVEYLALCFSGAGVPSAVKFLQVTSQNPESQYEALTKYARDLTEAAANGKLDPVIGRDDEIRRCMQILSRRTKNNPVLIGEAGVGKTAVAEGLAQRIIAGDVPDGLKGRQVCFLYFVAVAAFSVWRSILGRNTVFEFLAKRDSGGAFDLS